MPKKGMKRTEPLWGGPEKEGITQGLLSRFLNCRERFRLLVVEGLKSSEGFNHRLEYGNMWHVCEEALAANQPWEPKLHQYARRMCTEYPLEQSHVDKWYNVCKVQFPVYVNWWSKHPDVKGRTPLMQESIFEVPYKLPSGRTPILLGKFDSVDLINAQKRFGLWLQENKTKGDPDYNQLRRQLNFDLQTMFYLVALVEYQKLIDKPSKSDPWMKPILGVRYNVIKRPLSGGKGTIVQHKPTKKNPLGESKADYYQRLSGIISDSPSEYFMRWNVEVLPADIQKFREQFLDPILEQLCDWWAYVTDTSLPLWSNKMIMAPGCVDALGKPMPRPVMLGIHWRHPFGVYNILDEGGASDLDEYLNSGSEVGLKRTDDLFPELHLAA